MAKKRILICGATGFIGRNIAESFSRDGGMEVVGVFNKRKPFDHKGIEWIQADLTNAQDIERCIKGIDVIVQAAATTSGSKDIVSRPYIHVTDNAVMNSLLFRSAHDHGVGHVVFFSCSVMYPSSERPLSEGDFDARAGIHERYFGVGWTKVYIEKMCQFYAALGRTRYTAIRHSNVYGPHDKYDLERSHVFGATITKVMTAADGRLAVWGDGAEARDLIHVDDLTRFVRSTIERQTEPFALCNVGTGQAVSIKDLVHRIVKASGRTLSIEHDLSKPTIKTTLSLNCTKARRDFGWEPKVSLDEGIAMTLDWWRKNIGARPAPHG
ncbi:MAG: NAD-dependent epimerase/dehydratase family protein [Alphaproteobacteria bacterium]